MKNNYQFFRKKSKFAELIIRDAHAHIRVFHSVSHALVQVREGFWLLRARQTINGILKNCIIWKRCSPVPRDQTLARLPPACVKQANPFSVIGCDFAGPLFVKDSGNKQYIFLITCAVTRNVHLELVDNLSTDKFLLGFRRYYSIVYSDNAKTFKRSELERKNLWSIVTHPDVQEFFASHNNKWKYIIGRAAWWGGVINEWFEW